MPNLPTKVKFTNRSSAFSNKAFLEVKPKAKAKPSALFNIYCPSLWFKKPYRSNGWFSATLLMTLAIMKNSANFTRKHLFWRFFRIRKRLRHRFFLWRLQNISKRLSCIAPVNGWFCKNQTYIWNAFITRMICDQSSL